MKLFSRAFSLALVPIIALTLAPATFCAAQAAPPAVSAAPDEEAKITARMQAVLVEMTTLTQAQSDLLAPPSTDAPPTPQAARTAFQKADAKRAATLPATRERAKAAATAMRLAAQIAWSAFDAGRFDEAATWFARRAALKRESYASAKAFYLARFKATNAEFNALLNGVKQRGQAAPGTAQLAQSLLDLQAAQVALVQTLSLANNDAKTRLQSSQLVLLLRRTEVNFLTLTKADPAQILTAQEKVAAALEDIAGAQASLASFAQARRTYDEAIVLRRALPAASAEHALNAPFSDLGVLYGQWGDIAKARHFYEAALADLDASAAARRAALDAETLPDIKALRAANDLVTPIMILNNLGSTMTDAGDYKAALDYLSRAATIADQLSKEGIAGRLRASFNTITLNNMAVVHSSSGELDVALQEFNQVIAQHRAAGEDEDAAVALINAATIYVERRDNLSAQRYLNQALRLFAGAQDLSGVMKVTLFLSVLARRENKLPEAARQATQALILARKIGNLGWIGQAARGLAEVRLEQKQWSAVVPLLKEAAATDVRTGAPLDAEYTLELQGQLLEAQRQNVAALAAYQKAITLLESVRATAVSQSDFGSLESHYKVYERIVHLLIKMHRSTDAFDYLNRAKSKQLRDVMSVENVKTGNKALQALLDRRGTLNNTLRGADTELAIEQAKPEAEQDQSKILNLKLLAANTQAEFFTVAKQIKDAKPNFEQIMSVRPAQFRKLQPDIPEDTVLVEYAPLGGELFIFVATRETLKIYSPPVQDDAVWDGIKQFRKLLDAAKNRAREGDDIAIKSWGSNDATVAPLRDSLTSLYDMLITPIEPELANKKVIGFIPTDLLYYLPLHALAKKQGDGLHFLIEDHQVVYLSGADIINIAQQHDPATWGTGMTALGNPTGADLPHALEEVNTIAKIFPAAEVLSGDAATKSTMLEAKNLDKKWLHFATHGILNASVPGKSYIQLARSDKPEDSELTVEEIYGLDLSKTSLVTLSACQTALAEAKQKDIGTDVASIAESFCTAGAPSVVATLWSVSDESTKDLMVTFYQGLAAGKSKGEALQAAEIKVLKNPKFNHPFYWAPFILMGDWR